MAYSKKVIDKFEKTLENPEGSSVGRWDPKEKDIGTGMVGAPACGDVMRLQIKCESLDNSHSELVDMLLSKTLEEAKKIKNKDIAEALDLPPIKLHCSVLAEDSIHQAVKDYESKL